MCRLTSKSDREEQIRDLCVDTDYQFSGWVNGFKNSSSRIYLFCSKHGLWDSSVHNFVNRGGRCKGCQSEKTSARCRTDEAEIIERINSVDSKYTFVSWVSKYSGTKSKFVCKCSIHGEWSVTPLHFLYQKTGCPSCAGLKPYSKEERELQIVGSCLDGGYSFIGWIGEYKNSYSRFIYSCAEHGEIKASVNDFVNSGCRCRGCAESGFQKNKEAHVYALVSECGGMIKVGISNRIEARIDHLSKKTPFPFSIIEKIEFTGHEAWRIEKEIHERYQSAGLSGFDGCTEWLLFDHSILEDLRNPVMIGHEEK